MMPLSAQVWGVVRNAPLAMCKRITSLKFHSVSMLMYVRKELQCKTRPTSLGDLVHHSELQIRGGIEDNLKIIFLFFSENI